MGKHTIVLKINIFSAGHFRLVMSRWRMFDMRLLVVQLGWIPEVPASSTQPYAQKKRESWRVHFSLSGQWGAGHSHGEWDSAPGELQPSQRFVASGDLLRSSFKEPPGWTFNAQYLATGLGVLHWGYSLGVRVQSWAPGPHRRVTWIDTGLSENGAPKITKDHLNILNNIGTMSMKHDMLLGDTIFRQGHVVSFCFTDSPWLFYPRFDFSMVMEGNGWTTMAPKLWLVTLAQRDLHWVFPEMTPLTETIYSTHRGYPLVIEYSYGTWPIYRGFSHESCRVSQPSTFDHWSVTSYFPQSWTVLKPCGWRQASDLHIATECCSPYP